MRERDFTAERAEQGFPMRAPAAKNVEVRGARIETLIASRRPVSPGYPLDSFPKV